MIQWVSACIISAVAMTKLRLVDINVDIDNRYGSLDIARKRYTAFGCVVNEEIASVFGMEADRRWFDEARKLFDGVDMSVFVDIIDEPIESLSLTTCRAGVPWQSVSSYRIVATTKAGDSRVAACGSASVFGMVLSTRVLTAASIYNTATLLGGGAAVYMLIVSCVWFVRRSRSGCATCGYPTSTSQGVCVECGSPRPIPANGYGGEKDVVSQCRAAHEQSKESGTP